MSSRCFYGSKSSSSNHRTPLTLANTRIHETSRYLERDSHYNPGDRLQDKDGVSLSDEFDDEYEEDERTRRDKSPLHTPLGSRMLGLNSSYATPSRFDFFEPTQSRLRHRQDSLAMDHGGRDDRGMNFCTMLQEQQAMLQRILESQEALQDKHSRFEAKLAEIEQKCLSAATPTSSPSSDDTSGRKRKRVVTRDLSVSCILILGIFVGKGVAYRIAGNFRERKLSWIGRKGAFRGENFRGMLKLVT